MSEYTAIKQKNPKGILVFSILILFLFYLKIVGYYGADNNSTQKVLYYVFGGITLLGFSIFVLSGRNDSLIFSSASFLFFSVISTFINSSTHGHFLLSSLIDQSFFFGVLSVAYLLTYNKLNMQSLSNLMMAALVVYNVLYIKYRITDEALNASAINSIYYIVLLLPFAMCNKRIVIKALGISDIFLMAIISNKRTAFIMAVISIAVYFLLIIGENYENKGRKFILLFLLTVAVIIFVFFFDKIQKYFNFNTFDRLNQISEDNGSGRIEIYGAVLNSIKKFNLFEWMLGHGYNGVFLDSGLGVSAHNDFLEVLFDYGIFGFVAYLFMVKNIFKTAVIAFKQKSEYFAPSVISIIMFIFMSSLSHLIIYPSYIAYLMVFWGCMVNLNRGVENCE